MSSIRHLISELFNYDFAKCKTPAEFTRRFYDKTLTIADLKRVHDMVHAATCAIGGKTVPGAILVGDKNKDAPIMLLAQLHGNEPAGLAGVLLVFALAEAKMLTRQIVVVVGNPLASEQYFSAYMAAPRARQELRDAYRCGLGEGGILLPDMNRIPSDFMERKATNHHVRRAQELFHIASHAGGVLDIHSARGNMVCITDHKHNSELKNSPIRTVLMGLAEAISAHSSSGGTQVKTLKTILAPLPNIQYQVGIEAGRHETDDAPLLAAMFTHAFLHTIGASKATPHTVKKEDGVFECFHVQPKWTYGDLKASGKFAEDDKLFMVVPCLSVDAIPKRSDRVIVKKKDGGYQVQTIMQHIVQPAGAIEFAVYQYDELESVQEGAVVAVAVPSGVLLKAPATRAGIFFSKSAALYDKDPAVGPWPLPATSRNEVKFCYPCIVKEEKLKF
jgi:hypothetical protein